MKNKDVRHIFRTKCKQFMKTKQWCGYLTSQEIVLFVEAGIVFVRPEYDQQTYLRCKEDVSKGLGGSQWFYFYLPKGEKGNLFVQ